MDEEFVHIKCDAPCKFELTAPKEQVMKFTKDHVKQTHNMDISDDEIAEKMEEV